MGNKKRYYLMLLVFLICVAVYFSGFEFKTLSKEANDAVKQSAQAEGINGYGVSASHPLAVKVGMDILEKGGNAVDAAIAISYTLGVVEPYGSGIGGGGVMLVLENGSDKAVVYDYRETAPISGEIPPSNAGVPGFVKGMEVIHADLGSLPMKDLIQPAINYAKKGFKVDSYFHGRLKAAANRMPVEDLPHLYPKGEAVKKDKVLKQPELARTLTLIRDQGSDAFYTGTISKAILKEIESFSPVDLRNYSVIKRNAVHGQFGNLEVISAPPPVSGITAIQSLQMADILKLETTKNNEADFIHLTSEITKAAYQDRLKNIADPAFYSGFSEEILTMNYSKNLARDISLDNLSDDYEVIDSLADLEDHDNTTHFVVVDKEGNMVSATNTLGNFFGSGVYVNGFFLNSQISNFSMLPDGINSIEPGKRPRSFSSPMILRNDDYLMGIGSPGGKRIPAVVSQVILRHFYFNEPLQEAIDHPRFYSEKNIIYVENGFPKKVLEDLSSRGYEVVVKKSPSFYGAVQAIIVDKKENIIYGGADKRRNGFWQAGEAESDSAE